MYAQNDGQLGQWGTIIGTTLGIATDLWGGRGGGLPWEQDLINRGNGPPACPGSPTGDQAARAAAAGPPAEVKRISDQIRKSNGGNGPTPQEMTNAATAPIWVKAAMGGDDCQNKSAPWLPAAMMGLVIQYGGSQPASVSPYLIASDPGAIPSITPTQGTGVQAIDYVQLAKDAATAAAREAATGWLGPDPRTQLQAAQVAAAAPAPPMMRAGLPLILGAGLLLAMFVRK